MCRISKYPEMPGRRTAPYHDIMDHPTYPNTDDLVKIGDWVEFGSEGKVYPQWYLVTGVSAAADDVQGTAIIHKPGVAVDKNVRIRDLRLVSRVEMPDHPQIGLTWVFQGGSWLLTIDGIMPDAHDQRIGRHLQVAWPVIVERSDDSKIEPQATVVGDRG